MTNALVLDELKRLLKPDAAEITGMDFIRKALFLLSDDTRSFEIIRHDLMAIGTEAYRAEC